MRVLYLNPGGSAQGGAERSLAMLVQGMVARGHTAFVAVLMPGDAADLFADAGATVWHRTTQLDRVRRHGTTGAFAAGAVVSAPAVARFAAEVLRDVRKVNADIVHSNGFRTHLLAPFLRMGGARQVWSLRDVAPRAAQRGALAVASLGAHAVVANSRFTARQLAWRGSVVQVIPNPVCARPTCSRDDARAVLGLPLRRQVVAVVAHLHWSKGQHVAIEALAGWPIQDRPLFAIAGGRLYGEDSVRYEQRLRGQIAVSQLEGDVILLGGVADVGVLYAAADLVVQPAVHPEGFGRVVVEAQQSGVPVVATGIGGARELVEDGVSGLLVPPGDPVALRDAAAKILSDPEFARALSARGIAAGRRFSADRHVTAMEEVYTRVVSR